MTGSLSQRTGVALSIPRMEAILRAAWSRHVTEAAIVAFAAGVGALLSSVLSRASAESAHQRLTSGDIQRVLLKDTDVCSNFPGMVVVNGANARTGGLGMGVYYGNASV